MSLIVAVPARAQTVSMSGSLGDKALLVIDGAPYTVAAGSTAKGVKLISVTGSNALVEVQGKRIALALGGAPVHLGGAASDRTASQIVLSAGTGGHFLTTGSINGKPVTFMVDTGATFVFMGIAQAEKVGVDYKKGVRGVSNTANGPAVVYQVKLASVRVGDVQVYDVDALIGAASLDFVLLGNSFLTRFQMKRENDTMTLVKRY
jgi:aspartyl protease family protein